MTPRYLTCIAAILVIGQNLMAQEDPCQPCKVVSQPCIQAEPIVDCCHYPPAYNAPAAIDVSNECNWMSNLFADASFLYWYGTEEGLSVAINGVWDAPSTTVFLSQNTTPLIQSFDYHPGFKVGLGFVTDHQWQARADYTWLRGSTSLSQAVPTTFSQTSGSSAPLTGLPVWIVEDWFLQGTPGNQNLVGSNISSTWKYAIDFVDAVVGRPFYQGPSLTIAPFGGLRAAWIRQSMHVGLVEIPTLKPG